MQLTCAAWRPEPTTAASPCSPISTSPAGGASLAGCSSFLAFFASLAAGLSPASRLAPPLPPAGGRGRGSSGAERHQRSVSWRRNGHLPRISRSPLWAAAPPSCKLQNPGAAPAPAARCWILHAALPTDAGHPKQQWPKCRRLTCHEAHLP